MPTNIHFDLLPAGLTLITAVVILTCILQVLFIKVMGRERITRCHDVGGNYFAVVGTFYAVLLGLVIFDAQSRFEESKNNFEKEASSITVLYASLDAFPKSDSLEIKKHLSQYVDWAISYEWRSMTDGKADAQTRDELITVTKLIQKLQPHTERESIALDKIQDRLAEVWEMRRQRIDDCSYSIATFEWATILLGGFFTVFFTFFFVMEDMALQVAMTAIVAIVISVNIYLVYQFGNPYSGEIRISKNSFESVQEYITANP
jgi:hypothetical protein